MPSTPEQTRANIQARKDAETVIDKVAEQLGARMSAGYVEGNIAAGAYQTRFWETIAGLAALKIACRVVKTAELAIMSDKEAIAFEHAVIPYGMYAGELVGAVPPSYWAAITETSFNKDLQRYIDSDYYKAKINRDS